MDLAETLAAQWLARRFPGEGRVVHEPDGKVTPDFLVDGRLAIEVRRLNEHGGGADPRPLVETEIPFQRHLRSIAAKVPWTADRSLLVWVEYRRPLPSAAVLKTRARSFLESLMQAADPVQMSRKVTSAVSLRCLSMFERDRAPFIFGWLDLNSGGTPSEILQRNLSLCVLEKSRKTAGRRAQYPEWWLLLVSDVAFSMDELARPDVADLIQLEHDWDEVVVVDWFDTSQAVELSTLGLSNKRINPTARR